ncbi:MULTISPECIES: DUF2170 family protein [unclassified Halomonas]|uniref:DUF2170 family protein n=1 Tax=unclassified Halomonas TaxID=2609666 RepID=UPI0021E50FE2|nr:MULTISPECIES: DUF2170 family protein [unclassified Halomonas]UYG00370.1 DUF2170 family protein [Halomonas sp. GD1P12]WNL38555.1 DUF2170 family protein [Halomonas sp. PAMB 3232]
MTTLTDTPAASAAELHERIVASAAHDGSLEWPRADMELDEDNDTLIFALHDYGNLTLTLSKSDDEWVAMTTITPVDSVADQTALNEELLRQGVMLPLASVGIVTLDGRDYYVAYGQLFADSRLASICAELHATASAAMEVARLIQSDFSHSPR